MNLFFEMNIVNKEEMLIVVQALRVVLAIPGGIKDREQTLTGATK